MRVSYDNIWMRHLTFFGTVAVILLFFPVSQEVSDSYGGNLIMYYMDYYSAIATLFIIGVYAKGESVRSAGLWFAASVATTFIVFRLYFKVIPDDASVTVNLLSFLASSWSGYYVFKRRQLAMIYINKWFGTNYSLRETNFALTAMTYLKWALVVEMFMTVYALVYMWHFDSWDSARGHMEAHGNIDIFLVRDYVIYALDNFFALVFLLRLSMDFKRPDALGYGLSMRWEGKGRLEQPD